MQHVICTRQFSRFTPKNGVANGPANHAATGLVRVYLADGFAGRYQIPEVTAAVAVYPI